MKKILFSVIVSLSFLLVQSCNDTDDKTDGKTMSDTDVPPTVKTAFSAKYSTATDVRWEDAKEDSIQTYEAKITMDGKKMKAEFDGTGKLIKEEADNWFLKDSAAGCMLSYNLSFCFNIMVL